MSIIPAGQFNRGDVLEQKDSHGDFIIVRSVVEYELGVSGIAKLAVEIQAAGDGALQIYLNGELFDRETLAVPGIGLGRNDVPRWIRIALPLKVPTGSQKISLLLRCASNSLNVAARRVYQLRFTTFSGTGEPRPETAERKSWDYYSWLLERYPLAGRIQESPFLRPREPFHFDLTLPERPTAYPDAISSDVYGCQAGNTFFRCGEVYPDQPPSLGKFAFGPAATREAEKERIASENNLTGKVGEIELRSAGGEFIGLKAAGMLFQPHHIQTRFEAPGVRVEVDSAIDFSDMLEAKLTLTSDKPVSLALSGSFDLPGRWWPESGIRIGQTVFNYLVGLDVDSDVGVNITGTEKPLGYRIELTPGKQAKLVLRLKPGYRVKDIRAALLDQRKSPISVARRSWQEYHDFFARIVPPFACSDRRLVDIYHYVSYAVRTNVVDIPFRPFRYPYLTPMKANFGGIRMWPENVSTDALFLRWFNDKSLGEQVLRACVDADNDIRYLTAEPRRRPWSDLHRLGLFNTMGRATLTMYEFAKCSDDPRFFDLVKKVVRAMVEQPLENPFEDGALDAYNHMVPQYDFSLRYKPFTQGKVWWGSRMNQPLAHIDVNAWRYQLLCLAAAHARADGKPAAAEQMEERARVVRAAINRLMWDDSAGFYFDYAVKDRKRSDVMLAAAFSTLWAGVPDRERAGRLVKHLINPEEFWSRFVVPATSLADPRTNPRGYTDGSILLDVDNWFPFQGLLKMGYKDIAVELFWRTMSLMSANGIWSWACSNFMADDGQPHTDRPCPDAGVGVDMILRCGTGFVPRTDELFEFDPLILGPGLASLDWGPYRYKKHWIQVHWRASSGDATFPAGLTVLIDDARFCAVEPKHICLKLEAGRLRAVPPVPDPLGAALESR